jgi:hypothetical protein
MGARLRPEGAVAAAVADEELQTWNYGGRGEPGYISNRAGFHPGTRVIVDAVPRWSPQALGTKSGRSVAQRLQAGLRKRGYWPFRNCFEDATRLEPDRGGKTQLRVTMSANGTVLGARLLTSTLKNKEVGQCIVRAIRSVHTDRPLGRALDADVTVSTWPGDLPLMPAAQPATLPRSALSKIDAVVRTQQGAFESCFVEARQLDPQLWGRLALVFFIENDGRAASIQEVDSHFGSTAAVRCVADRLAAMVLPVVNQLEPLQLAFRLARPDGPSSSEGTDNAVSPVGTETKGARAPQPQGNTPPPDGDTPQLQVGSRRSTND